MNLASKLPIQERRLVFNPAANQFQVHNRQERFVRTIPLAWLQRCNQLLGKATAVATALWFLAGINKSLSFRLTAEAVAISGCSRSALYQCLGALEDAGLIEVQRRVGARPQITLCNPPEN